MQKRLKIGIGLDAPVVSSWIYCLIERIEKEQVVVIESIFLAQGARRNENNGMIRQFHMAFDKKYFKPLPDAFEEKNIQDLLGNESMVTIDVLLEKEAKMDLIIWLSQAAIPSSVYQLSRQGIWAYLHGTKQATDQQSLGYREFVKMTGVIKSALQQKKSEEDQGIILYESWSMMPSVSMSRGRNEHFWKILSFIPRALKKLSVGKLEEMYIMPKTISPIHPP